MTIRELNNELGNIDIYLLDQILKGRYSQEMKILDAGCGEGRNILYFLNNGYDVFGIDQNPDAIRMMHFILGSKYPNRSKKNFSIGEVSSTIFADKSFDLVISSAVLHFAKDHDHFKQMFAEMTRVLKPQGQLFIRMASDIGLNGHKTNDTSGKYFLPDGSIRYLITQGMIKKLTETFSLEFIEPIKTTNVSDLRCMTTLVLRKK